MPRCRVLTVVVAATISHTALADALFVDDDAPLGGDGSSWGTAYRFLQDALANAPEGAEIRIAQGTYRPDQDETGTVISGDREATFRLLIGVTIEGGYAGLGTADPDARDIELYETILAGDLLDDDGPGFANNVENSYHVVTGASLDQSAVLDGLTISGGNASASSGEDAWGGGMLLAEGDPAVSRCTFRSNTSNAAIGAGGGLVCTQGASPTLDGCTFSGNACGFGGGGILVHNGHPVLFQCAFSENTGRYGGGLSLWGPEGAASATLTECTFTANSAQEGGGMYAVRSEPTLYGCQFSGNTADNFGGGLAIVRWDEPPAAPVVENCIFDGNNAPAGAGAATFNVDATFTGCSFLNNIADDGADGGVGGGVLASDPASPKFIDCDFSANSALGAGGGMFAQSGSQPQVRECTLDGNSATLGGGMYAAASSPTVVNSRFTGNTAQWGGGLRVYSRPDGISHVRLANCTFSANSAPNGRAIACDSDEQQNPSDVHLANSIFWNGGDEIRNDDGSTIAIIYSDVAGGWPGPGNIDADPLFVDPDNGDFRLQAGSPCIDAGHNWAIAGLAETDLDGNPRFADDPVTADAGCGIPVVVDMGAYEYPGDPFAVRLGDVDGDGVVNVSDFLLLLEDWGPCPAECCLADLDLDTAVGVTDFLILLANWGP